jgi:SAM-dependent methyltransferase
MDSAPKEDAALHAHLAAQAEDLARARDFFWHRARSRFALEGLRELVGPRPTVLDVGAGAGVFGDHFREAFPEGTYAFEEPVAALVRKLRERFSPAADRSGKPCEDADAAVLLDVLEHQADDAGFLSGLQSRLRPGALLIVTAPALPCLWSAWDVQHGHFRRYDRGSLRSVLSNSGFEVLRCRYLFQSMVLPGLLRRLRPAGRPEFPDLPRPLNALLLQLCRAESACLGWLPFGTSVAAIARRNH